MSNYEIEWELDSLDDREGIYSFLIENASESVADAVEDRIKEASKLLAQFPDIGINKYDTDPPTQLYSVNKCPYLLHYVSDEKKKIIKILRVFHAKQKH